MLCCCILNRTQETCQVVLCCCSLNRTQETCQVVVCCCSLNRTQETCQFRHILCTPPTGKFSHEFSRQIYVPGNCFWQYMKCMTHPPGQIYRSVVTQMFGNDLVRTCVRFASFIMFWFLFWGQRLRINFLSFSVCFIYIDDFFCSSFLIWWLDKIIYNFKY